ncbi:TIGR04053 family radical SAM/SPASM domain-containing protein [Ferroplasma sp.]|uniref:TIGR04053 family radical SAM/SPASM domain-containing protein n=1 Tax=Ferroplasma sp. TaxID=2591003 RepID=UPI00307E43E7
MIDYNEKPILIFWETTKACGLACRHCRASAMENSLPDELTDEDAKLFINSITEFGKPYPVLILTGGDMMRRKNIDFIIEQAEEDGIPVSISPAATDLLTYDRIKYFQKHHVLSASLSLDGNKEMHDWLRGNGVYDKTMELIKLMNAMHMKLQINSVVMRKNIEQLPELLKNLIINNVKTWEVFFLIQTGRAIDSEDLTALEFEDINHWLLFAMNYGITIRTVESPIFRRIIDQGNNNYSGKLYYELVDKTIDLLGIPEKRNIPSRISNTRDGKGIIFVGYNGDVFPSGFVPYKLDNIKEKSIVSIYRNNETLKLLRDSSNFEGNCGICAWTDSCGGSRSRAYARYNDIFARDPACLYS